MYIFLFLSKKNSIFLSFPFARNVVFFHHRQNRRNYAFSLQWNFSTSSSFAANVRPREPRGAFNVAPAVAVNTYLRARFLDREKRGGVRKSRKRNHDRRGGRESRLHRWMKAARAVLTHTRSRELWVSHIFADVQTTKSFSLAALFSTRKSCSVTDSLLVRNDRARLPRELSKKTRVSLFTPEKALRRSRWR